MRYFSYYELDDKIPILTNIMTVSEEQIRETYWPFWYGKMCKKYGKEEVDKNWSFEDCLEDWKTTNWAWEVKE